MLRFVPPAGAPVGASDILRCLILLSTRRDPRDDLRRQVTSQMGMASCEVVSTGRAGLTVILRALKRLAGPARDEVIVPSYTCYSVAASIVKAGLKVRPVDLNPETLDIDHAELESMPAGQVLAVVATSLYGLPNDLPRLERFARDRRIFLIDDAAQSMGARIEGRLCGTFGDAGLFSLDKGKNVSAIDGGLVVTSSPDVARALAAETRGLTAPSYGDALVWWVKLGAYAALLHPRLYWIPNGIPFLKLGSTVYTTEYPMTSAGRPAAALALAVLPRLEQLTDARRRTAETLLSLLRGIEGVTPVIPAALSEPAYLRLPVLVRDADSRNRLIADLNAAGIGASSSYPGSIVDIPALSGWLRGSRLREWRGQDVARRILTLPTHPLVTASDLQTIADVVRRSLARTVSAATPQVVVH